MSALLSTDGLSVRYGGVRALADLTMSVAAGELVGLIGPNGAGKTTFIDAVTGFTASTGSVRMGDDDVSHLAPHQRLRRGLARTWQSGELFDDLTVRENLSVSASRPSIRATLRQLVRGRGGDCPEADSALELLGLSSLAERPVDAISQGQRKLVGVGRALVTGASIICLDEPAAGLDTTESRALGARLREVADRGTALVLVDHDMELVLGICDRLFVLNFGALIAAGTPREIVRDPTVIEAYLGAASHEVSERLS